MTDNENIYISWKMIATALAIVLVALVGIVFDRTVGELDTVEVKQEKVISKVGIE